jgi:anti-sigma B factor antagonist
MGHLNITQRTTGNVTILDLVGTLIIGMGDAALRSAISGVMESGAQNILLNVAGVTRIDSSGIGELVSSYTGAATRGGKLKLMNLPSRIQDILTITQLITIFETYDNETEAVESFS